MSVMKNIAIPSLIAAGMIAIPVSACAQAADPMVKSEKMMKDEAMTKKNYGDHQAWADILSTYTAKDGSLVRFDYKGLANNADDRAKLDNYIESLEAMKPSAMGKDKALAYWANLYNAVTIKVVVDNYPVKSIRDIKSGVFTPGPWKKDLVTVEGRTMTLDNIEHDTMRANWDEPRIHYMVNCASIGCPNLKQTPWTADNLDAELDKAAKAFVNSPRGLSVSGGKITTSKIYDWFDEDFGGSESGVIAHLSKYASGERKDALQGASKIKSYEYDWSLNAK